MGIGVVLNQRFEVNIKVRENSRQQSQVGWDADFDLPARKLGEDIAPGAVSEKKHDLFRSVSGGQLPRKFKPCRRRFSLTRLDSGTYFVVNWLFEKFFLFVPLHE